MILAVEDTLSEAIAKRLLAAYRAEVHVDVVIGFKGNSYLKARARELNRTAGSVPVFLLTDFDRQHDCPAELIAEWLGKSRNNLLFRVAVREVEAWLVADRNRFAAFLSVPAARIPSDADSIPDPKQFIVNLARRSRQGAIQTDLVPAVGSTAIVGPGFNARLVAFASTVWQPDSASYHSESLRRAIQRIAAR
jgi:hypothetical protein